MRYTMAFIVMTVMCLSACDAYVEKQKYVELQAQLKVTQAKLDEAQKRLAEYESHRYSLFNSGFRTFRLDSVTGATCIKLTTNDDWKKKEVQRQSCDCADYLSDVGAQHNEQLGKLFCGF